MTATATTLARPPARAVTHRREGRQVALLALVLLGAVLVTRPGTAFMSDEGLALVQVDLLAEGHWLHDSPLDGADGLDPDGSGTPFRAQVVTEEGSAPYGKHPVYPVLLLGARWLAGPVGPVLVSVAGGILAAIAAGCLARRLGAPAGDVAFWVCGLASPLLFDSLIVFGHTVAAALVTLALLAAVRPVTSRPSGSTLALVAGAIAVACLLRNEALVVAGGIAVASVVAPAGGRRRGNWLAAASLGGAAAAWLLDAATRALLFGEVLAQRPPAAGEGERLADRLSALQRTLLDSGYGEQGVLGAVLAAWVLGCAAVLWAVLRGRAEATALKAVLAAGVGLHAVRLASDPDALVPGLLIAFPLAALLPALLVAGRPVTPPQRFLALALGLSAAGILLAQYRTGGGLEWGGRYLAVLLPAAAALAAARLPVRTGPAPQPSTGPCGATSVGRWVVGAVLAIGMLTAVGSVLALRHYRTSTEAVEQAIAAAGELAGPGPASERPLVVTPEPLLPQIVSDVFAGHDWLAPDAVDLPALAGRLERAEVERFVLVTADPDRHLDVMAAWPHAVEVPVAKSQVHVYVLSQRG